MRIEWNFRDFQRIRKEDAVWNEVDRVTRGIAEDCGSHYSPSVWEGKDRVRGRVWATHFKARRDNHRNNTLLKVTKSWGGGSP